MTGVPKAVREIWEIKERLSDEAESQGIISMKDYAKFIRERASRFREEVVNLPSEEEEIEAVEQR